MASISELAAKLDAPNPDARVAQQAILEQVWHSGAKGKEHDRAELGEKLAAELAGKHSLNGACKLAQYASLASSGKQAETIRKVAESASDPKTAQMARWALDRITGDETTAALVKLAAEGKSLDMCVGAINALARRSGAAVVEVLKNCAKDKEPEVALAAGEALAHQGDAALDATIAGIHAGNDRARQRIGNARLQLAGALAKAGKTDAAQKIYQSVAANAPAAQKKAAQLGIKAIG